MKAERKGAGRCTVANFEKVRARGVLKSASSGGVYGDQTDEFDGNFLLEDEGILDEADSDMSDWCDAQDVARELAGRAWN